MRFRVEVEVSAWRPRGQAPPRVTLSTAEGSRQAAVSSRRQTLVGGHSSTGWWRGDVVAALDAETFRPGPSDARRLGARVHTARLVPLDGVVALRRPPLGRVAAVAWAAAF